eukprot:TRINITY_DN11627_c0_g1_i1.p1 TRINITY_DN11627_c0_g1~~TRINITY_DN11627_c0_g1_i1.p1  ORF type:complete len:243 (+),score=47.61 TRINITY_DN11627_c0_g1_i1:24-752(+)
MSLFSALKEDYQSIVSDCKAHLRAINESSNPLEQEKLIREATECIKEAEGVIQAMKLTASNAANGQELVGVLGAYKEELSILKQTLSQYTETNEQEKRNRLMPNRDKDRIGGELDDTAKARQLTDKMNRTTKTLLHVDELASEAIEIGGSTLDDLKDQGVRMQSSRNQLGDMNDLLAIGKNIMNNIRTKLWTNQGLKIIVIVVLVICNLIILYLGFFWTPERPLPPPHNVTPHNNNTRLPVN